MSVAVFDTGVPGVETSLEMQVKQLHRDIVSQLADRYTLMYIDRSDSLSDSQVQMLFDGLGLELECDIEEELWEQRAWASEELADDELRKFKGIYSNEAISEYVLSDFYIELQYEISGRNDSDPVSDLIRNTHKVFVRGEVPFEPPVEGFERVEDFVDAVIAQAGLLDAPANRDALEGIYATPLYGDELQVIAYVDLSDLLEAKDNGGHVVFESPSVLLMSAMSGSGWDAEIAGDVVVRADSIAMDSQAGGYSWEDICGAYLPAYACDVRAF